MSKQPRRSRIELLTGPGVCFYAYEEIYDDEGKLKPGEHLPLVGRGSGFSDQGNFPRIPVAELGMDGINEYGAGQAVLTFTLQRFEGVKQGALNSLPFRSPDGDSWIDKKSLIFVAVKHYGPNHARPLWTFYGCELQSRSRGGAAGAAVTGNHTFVYKYEKPADWVLDMTDVVEEKPDPETP